MGPTVVDTGATAFAQLDNSLNQLLTMNMLRERYPEGIMWDSQTGVSPLIFPAVTHLEPPVPNAIPKQMVRPREPEVGIAEEYEMIPGPAASVNEAAETPVPMDTEGLAQATELPR